MFEYILLKMSYNYRSVLYKDYYQNQSGRAFQLQIEEKMKNDANLFSAEILPLLPKDKAVKILDIGCGFGSLIKLLKDSGYTNLAGIDLSESQVAMAHQFGLTEVEVNDINDFLSSKENSYDVITGIDIIEHFSKDELIDLLSIIKKSLKPNGIAIFRTPNNDAPFATIYSRGDFTHENYLNGSSAEQLMLSMGFCDIAVKESHIVVAGLLKEIIRNILWRIYTFKVKLLLFASGRGSKNVLLSPNMIIKVKK
jgi:2-polyprenyl-3-methyl-5-hydroxy-6-metoxy-1,4-benzoquinol methylase